MAQRIPEKIITADSRGRINLGANAIGKSFALKEAGDGEYLLTEMIVIPKREAWLWQNPEARASFETGVHEAEIGLGKVMDFSSYGDDESDDPHQ